MCRTCHDTIEEMKRFKKLKKAYETGKEETKARILKLINEKKFRNENWCNEDLIIVEELKTKLEEQKVTAKPS